MHPILHRISTTLQTRTANFISPEKYEHYLRINEEGAGQYPVIEEKKDPLPTAKTLKEILGE